MEKLHPWSNCILKVKVWFPISREDVTVLTQNHRRTGVWRRSSSPTINPILPSPPLNHGPKGCIYRFFMSRVGDFTTSMGTQFQWFTTLSGKEFFLRSILKIDKIIMTIKWFSYEKQVRRFIFQHTPLCEVCKEMKGCVFSIPCCKGQLIPHVKSGCYRSILHSSYHSCQLEDWKALLGTQVKFTYQENSLLTL